MGILEIDGTLRDANRSALELIGDPDPEEVIGKPFWNTPWWSHDPAMQERLRQAFADVAGYSREEALGQSSRLLDSGHHDKAFFEQMFATIAREDHWLGEIWNRTKAGAISVVLMAIGAVRDAAGELTHYVGIFTDITRCTVRPRPGHGQSFCKHRHRPLPRRCRRPRYAYGRSRSGHVRRQGPGQKSLQLLYRASRRALAAYHHD